MTMQLRLVGTMAYVMRRLKNAAMAETMMEVRCAYCGCFIRWSPGPPGKVSHGACDPCAEREMEGLRNWSS